MNARIAQLVSRYLGVALAALLTKLGIGYENGTLDSIVGPVATAAGLLGSIVLDHYLHRVQEEANKRGIKW